MRRSEVGHCQRRGYSNTNSRERRRGYAVVDTVFLPFSYNIILKLPREAINQPARPFGYGRGRLDDNRVSTFFILEGDYPHLSAVLTMGSSVRLINFVLRSASEHTNPLALVLSRSDSRKLILDALREPSLSCVFLLPLPPAILRGNDGFHL